MTLITKPVLEDRQFSQPQGKVLKLNGETNFLGILKSKGIEISAKIEGEKNDFDQFALVYDHNTDKIILKEVVSRYSGVAERNVGGIVEGTVFDGSSMQEMWDNLIMEEKFPTLVNPSITNFSASETGFREIGSIINNNFNITFNRGKIEIISTTYNFFEYRCGNVVRYVFSGNGLNVENITSNLTSLATLSNYEIINGNQNWNCTVYFNEGIQPKTSYGNNYDAPYPAGNIVSVNRTVTGVYPFFATTNNIATYTKRPLAAHGSQIVVDMVAENVTNKQSIQVPVIWGVLSRIEQFNELSNQWDIININSFTQTSTILNINGYNVNYNVYTHNSSLIGSRRLRFTF